MSSTPTRRAPRIIAVAGLIALGLVFAACNLRGGDGEIAIPEHLQRKGDATREQFVETYAAGTVSPELGECVTDELFENLDQDDLNTLYDANYGPDNGDDIVDADEYVDRRLVDAEHAAYMICDDPQDLVPDDHD